MLNDLVQRKKKEEEEKEYVLVTNHLITEAKQKQSTSLHKLTDV